jgi:hypothetical protein
MLVSDCCEMISETRDSVTDETVALIPVGGHSGHALPLGFQPVRANSGLCDYMKPGLRGRYRVQLPKSFVDINTIGIVRRIP